eukprot:gnl/TRDRNA2_/TRDRNA2_116955_c0_seq1.p1 gnl/TRDRNA2_/TRDRNA2_116955_c0~~gnl/TRDRNA2_/TRDRNA2_116955_c0_seq1.p1  ORF type:complete len:100 (-),score=13.65 gnl/TRDRNA2_/TRDRNA2_116955_c0_seq1:86-385(-)
MSWDCDCWSDMMKRCNEAGAKNKKQKGACLRTQFCMHPNICKSWRDAVCNTKNVRNWMHKLQEPDTGRTAALQARLAEAGSSTRMSTDVETTMAKKECH